MASCTAAGDDESDSSKQKSNGVLRRGNPNVDRSSLTALCEQELEAFGKLRVLCECKGCCLGTLC